MCFLYFDRLTTVEVIRQNVGNGSSLRLQVSAISCDECGAIPWDEFQVCLPLHRLGFEEKNKSFNYLLNTHTHTHTRTQQPFSLFEHFSCLSFLFATFFSGLVFPIDCFDYTLFLLFPCFHSVCVVFPHTIIMIIDNLWYGGFTTSFERCISVFLFFLLFFSVSIISNTSRNCYLLLTAIDDLR